MFFGPSAYIVDPLSGEPRLQSAKAVINFSRFDRSDLESLNKAVLAAIQTLKSEGHNVAVVRSRRERTVNTPSPATS